MRLLGIRLPPKRWRVLCCFVLVGVFVCGGMGVALAAPAVLVMVRTVDNSDPTPYELRLRSELAAEGIAAVVVNPTSNPGDSKQLAAKFGANAVVEVTVSAMEVATSIWAAEPSLGLEVTRNLRVSSKERDVVGVFALRTVDFLQGARIELEQQRQTKLALNNANGTSATGSSTETPVGSSTVTTTTKPKSVEAAKSSPVVSRETPNSYRVAPPRPRPESAAEKWKGNADGGRIRIGVAYSLLQSSDEFGWSTAPGLAVAWFAHPRWAIGVSALGPYLNHIGSSSGQFSITVDQELFSLDGRYRAALSESFDLEPHVGLGLARYTANGTANSSDFVGYHAKSWSGFTLVGCTLVWRIGARFRLLTDAMAIGRWENPYVQVDNSAVTGNSRWNLVIKAGPGWAF